MADDSNKLEIQISVDNKQAKQALDETAAASSKLKDTIVNELGGSGSNALGRLASVLTTEVQVAIGAVAAAVTAFKVGLDLTIQAEKIEQINRSFDALASSAHLAGEQIREGVIDATRGLADDDDVIQAAGRGIVALGQNAARIPEIMDVARRATALFGGELTQNFERLNDALASGNARALRQFGIYIDGDAAVKRHSASLGVATSVLTDAGQKQAIFNEGLSKAQQVFSGVDEDAPKATHALQELKVSLQQLGDQVAEATRASGFFAGVLGFLKDSVEGYTGLLKGHFGSAQDQLKYKFDTSAGSIVDLQEKLASLKEDLKDSSGLDRSNIVSQIAQTQLALNVARREYLDIQKQINDAEPKEKSGKLVLKSAQNATAPGDKNINQDALRQLQTQFAQTALQIRASREQSETELLNLGAVSGNAQAAVEAQNFERIALINAQFDEQEKDLQEKRRKRQITDEGAFSAALININLERANKIKAIQQQQPDQVIAVETKQTENNPAVGFDAIVKSFENQSKQMKDIAAQTAASIRNSFVTGFSAAFSAMGNAFATGKNGFAEFGKSVLSTLGSLCITLGQFFFLVGAGLSATTVLLGVSGAAAIGVGAALTVLGGVLQGLAGGGAGASGTSTNTGGTSVGTGSPELPATNQPTKSTAVTINIQGNVLDRRETGMYIAETLNEYFSASGGQLVAAS